MYSRLLFGDALKRMDRLISEGVKVDAVIADVPYGLTACKWDSVIPLTYYIRENGKVLYLHDALLKGYTLNYFNSHKKAGMWERLKFLRKDNTPIVLFGSEPFSSALRMSNIKEFKYDWVWKKSRKTGFQMVRYRPMKDYELISVFYKKQPLYKNTELQKLTKPIKSWRKNGKGGNLLNRVSPDKNEFQKYTGFNTTSLYFSNEHNVGALRHPCQKPLALMVRLVKTYTNENDLILDFTMGGGTTGVAAVKLNRSFIGIEKERESFDMAKKRIGDVMENSLSKEKAV